MVFSMETGIYDNVDIFTLPEADADTLGGVRIGSGINVLGGTISVLQQQAQPATSSQLGVVQIGSGVDITEAGVISVPAQQIPLATSSTPGLVTIGSGINVTSGQISVTPQAPPSLATTSTAGIVQVGTGINVSNGVISIAGAGSTPDYWTLSAPSSNVQVTPNGTLTFLTSTHLANNIFTSGVTNSGGIITIANQGIYQVSYQLTFHQATGGMWKTVLYIYKENNANPTSNSTIIKSVSTDHSKPSITNDGDQQLITDHCHWIGQLNANDRLQCALRVFTNTSGNPIVVSNASGYNNSVFTGIKLA